MGVFHIICYVLYVSFDCNLCQILFCIYVLMLMYARLPSLVDSYISHKLQTVLSTDHTRNVNASVF